MRLYSIDGYDLGMNEEIISNNGPLNVYMNLSVGPADYDAFILKMFSDLKKPGSGLLYPSLFYNWVPSRIKFLVETQNPAH
jgi:hypothetical protein